MHKMTRTLVLIFFCGILLMGVGCGIAFVEYSSLEYEGVHVIGNKENAELIYTIETEEERTLMIEKDNRPNWRVHIAYDDTMPKDQIKWKINYNKEIMLPYLEYYDEEDGRVIYMGMQRVPRGEFEIFMREKESFLQDLKEGKIWSYDIDRHVEIEISFHSDLKEKIRIL